MLFKKDSELNDLPLELPLIFYLKGVNSAGNGGGNFTATNPLLWGHITWRATVMWDGKTPSPLGEHLSILRDYGI